MTDVEQAIADRQIVRTWPMRGTLHLVAAEDVRWMQALLTPRIIASSVGHRKKLGIDDAKLQRAETIIRSELSGGKRMTRAELFQALEAGGVSTDSQRGAHLLNYYFSHIGLLCLGPNIGKKPAFVLLDEWLPATEPIPREQALGKLAERYFTSHGPATLKDFAGWAYLPMADARRGIELAKEKLVQETINDTIYWSGVGASQQTSTPTAFLLPGFDEFILGYKDRSAMIAPEHANKIVPGGNGMFLATIVINGRVVGTWKKTVRKTSVGITLLPFAPLPSDELELLAPAVKRYGEFLGLPATLL